MSYDKGYSSLAIASLGFGATLRRVTDQAQLAAQRFSWIVALLRVTPDPELERWESEGGAL